jgi:isoleucyl-tRNA synthetase
MPGWTRSSRCDSRWPWWKSCLADTTHQSLARSARCELLREELNVKKILYTTDAHYIAYQVQPNFKRLGPRLGKNMPAVKKLLGQADGAELLHQLKTDGQVRLEVAGETLLLDEQDLQVTVRAKEGWAAADDAAMGCVVVLNTQLSPELVREGYARDLVRLVNERRKELGCDYNDRIQVGLVTPSSELATAVEENEAFIRGETLAVKLTMTSLENGTPVPLTVADQAAELYVAVVKP